MTPAMVTDSNRASSTSTGLAPPRMGRTRTVDMDVDEHAKSPPAAGLLGWSSSGPEGR
jgi:hypothetical protein